MPSGRRQVQRQRACTASRHTCLDCLPFPECKRLFCRLNTCRTTPRLWLFSEFSLSIWLWGSGRNRRQPCLRETPPRPAATPRYPPPQLPANGAVGDVRPWEGSMCREILPSCGEPLQSAKALAKARHLCCDTLWEEENFGEYRTSVRGLLSPEVDSPQSSSLLATRLFRFTCLSAPDLVHSQRASFVAAPL